MILRSWPALAGAAGACAIVAASCGSPTGGGGFSCTGELLPAIEVDVFDARTGTPAAAGATVLLSGSAQDSVTAPSTSGALVIAKVWYEDRVKAGSYSVTVRKAGYSDWTQSNIRVQFDRCHVQTFERLAARLEPVAP